jgi:hypothetical protein
MKGGGMMLGIHDFTIALVYVLCIMSALLCLVYGIVNWNKGDPDIQDISAAAVWEKEEIKVDDEI